MRIIQITSIAAFVASASMGTPFACCGELLFSQLADGQSTYGPSLISSDATVNSEIADDFYVVGNIDRVGVGGFIWGDVLDFRGVYVRFYEFGADNKPGRLQAEYLVPASDSNLVIEPSGYLEVPLSPYFSASGKHFISVQPLIDYWYWWSANSGAPRGESFYFRDRATGQIDWQKGDNLNVSNTNADVSFLLYGGVTAPGQIDGLSTNLLARSGYLEILGANFGGGGEVLIGGLPAPIADWSNTRIVAYVPEAAALGTLPVQVANVAGPSNVKQVTVTTRQAGPRVNWRFRMNGPYAQVRPVIGPDNTLYAVDVFQHLYALAPDGALKWLVRGAGEKGVAVGADNTIYVASEDFIKAFNVDGTEKWTFVQNPRAFICLGVAVGPDGNIYSVGTQGLGVFSLTPRGELRWATPEFYSRRIVDYAEIVFGPNGANQQLYFAANHHLRALDLDGHPVFALAGEFGQPTVGPDGNIHEAFGAYSPNGSLVWGFSSPYPYNTVSAPDVGSDGTHYVVQNISQLFALNPNGSQRWHKTLTNYVDGPIVDPANTMLVLRGVDTLNYPGAILAVNATNGDQLWRLVLPAEDPTLFNPYLNQYGFNQFVDTRGRFSQDGQTVYFVTATATGDNNTSKSFVYSINATGTNPPPLVKLRVSDIFLATRNLIRTLSVSGVVVVKDETGATVPGATVNATWTKPEGIRTNVSAATQIDGTARFSIKGSGGSYTLTVDSISKTGYTFDPAGSATLSKSIKGVILPTPKEPLLLKAD